MPYLARRLIKVLLDNSKNARGRFIKCRIAPREAKADRFLLNRAGVKRANKITALASERGEQRSRECVHEAIALGLL
jgi:hypothetical protein